MLIIVALSITFQMIAAIAALRLIGLTGYRFSWGAVASALFLMVIRRVIVFCNYGGLYLKSVNSSHGPVSIYDALGLLISFFMMLGIIYISPLFKAVKLHEQALSEAKKSAEAANEAKSVFVANVSHDLKTPLNSIIGFAALMDGSGLNALQQEYNDLIKLSSGHLLDLINDILDFSKIEAKKLKLEKKSFSIYESIKQTFALALPQADYKKLKMSCLIDAQIPNLVIGDELRFRQILMNLITNAIKYTYEGEIEIKAAFLSADEKNTIIAVSVSDTGIGIAPDKHDEIFERFQRVENKDGKKISGTGLGLAIVKNLTDMMNGKITVESRIGKGSVFTAQLQFETALPV